MRHLLTILALLLMATPAWAYSTGQSLAMARIDITNADAVTGITTTYIPYGASGALAANSGFTYTVATGDVRATSFTADNVDGTNSHGFFDNPGGYTCAAPGDNTGSLAMDSSIDADGDQLYFCDENGNMMRIVREDTGGTTILVGKLSVPGQLNITGTDDFKAAQFVLTETTPNTEYILKMRVYTNGNKSDRIWIGNGPTQIKSGGEAGDAGLEIFDESDGAETITITPPTSIGANYTQTLQEITGSVGIEEKRPEAIIGATLGPSDILDKWYLCTNAGGCNITLPALGAGDHFCVYDTDGTVGITLTPAAGVTFWLPDGTTTDSAGDVITSDTGNLAGDRICVVALNATTFFTYAERGTWTDGTP